MIPTIGAVAQLGERVNGIHEVSGSIPLGSTNSQAPDSQTICCEAAPLGARPERHRALPADIGSFQTKATNVQGGRLAATALCLIFAKC